jgi:hypothetical protein
VSSWAPASWHWRRAADVDAAGAAIVGQIQSIFRDGFGCSKDWPETNIRQRLKNSSVVGLLEIAGAAPAGYAIYSSPEQTLDGKFVLWEDSICIRQAFHARKMSRPPQLLYEVGGFLGREFGWFGGDTQNPVVYKRYARLGRVFPIDMPFTSETGQRVLNFLLESVPQVRDRARILDVRSGALRGIYTEGWLGQYEVGISGAEPFEEYLSRHEIRRERGDALLLMAKVRDDIEDSRPTADAEWGSP